MRTIFLWLVAAGLLSLSIAVAAFAQCQLAFNDEPRDDTDIAALIDEAALSAIDPYSAELSGIPATRPEIYLRTAWEAYEAGDYERAARAYLYVLDSQRDPLVIYNLACCYGLLGRGGLAAKFLGYAAEHGYRNADYVDQDPDFDSVRADPGFIAAVEQMRADSAAAIAAQSGEDMYIGFPLLMKCRTVMPADYDAYKTYPLVIGLHGAGDTPERFGRLCEYFDARDFIYAAPQAPYCMERNGYLWFNSISEDDSAAGAEARTLNSAYIMHLIDRLKTEHNIGDVYLVGFSQGAAMAYLTGLSHPEAIDGIVVFGGWLDESWLADGMLEKAAAADGGGLRVFIAHGDEDGLDRATSARDVLARAGVDVELHEFHGGHFIHLDTLHLAEQWMKQAPAIVAAHSAADHSAPLAAPAATPQEAATETPHKATMASSAIATTRDGK